MFSLSVFRQGPRSLRAAAAASCVPEMPRVYFATSKTTTEPPKKELVSTMDLAKIVAKKHNMSQKDAKAILDTITDAISEVRRLPWVECFEKRLIYSHFPNNTLLLFVVFLCSLSRTVRVFDS